MLSRVLPVGMMLSAISAARGFLSLTALRRQGVSASRRLAASAAASPSAGVALTPLPSLDIAPTGIGADAWKGEMLVLSLYAPKKEDGDNTSADDRVAELPEAYQALDEGTFGGEISALIAAESFPANAGDTACVRLPSGSAVGMLALVGLGPAGDDSVDSTKFGTSLASLAKDRKPRSMGVVLPYTSDASKVVTGMLDSLYAENRFKTGPCLCDGRTFAPF